MAIICNDFIAIAKELEQFYNIFTPELKSVTGKPHKINEILDRVHKVLELIEHVNPEESFVFKTKVCLLFFRHPVILFVSKIMINGKWLLIIMLNKSKKSMNKQKVSFLNPSKLYGREKKAFSHKSNLLSFYSSAESAFDMLLKFEKNNTRMTIQDEMHKRFNDILRQYDNEVNFSQSNFLFRKYFFVDHRN